MKKKDVVFILTLLVVALASWTWLTLAKKETGRDLVPSAEEPADEEMPENTAASLAEDYGFIRISVGGNYYGTYSLGEDQIIKINDTNVIEIKDGEANMIHAECPDQLCTYMGPIKGEYGLIVCLPNAVIVEGFAPEKETEDSELEIDGIS